jgi:hypothetical protein
VHVKRWWRAVVLAVACLLAAGCGKFNAILTVDGDVVSGTYTMAVSDDLARQANIDPTQLWGAVDNYLSKRLPAQLVATPDTEPGFTGSVYTFTDQPLDRIPLLTNQYLRIVRQDGRYTATGWIDLTDIDTAMRQQGFSDTLINSMSTEVTIAFPGPVASANGRVNGNRVTWQPLIGAETAMAAVALDNPDATPVSSATDHDSASVIDLAAPTTIPTIELPAIDGLLTDRPTLDLGASSAPGWTKWIPKVLIGSCVTVAVAAIGAYIARRRNSTP